MSWAPLIFVPAPLRASASGLLLAGVTADPVPPFPILDFRITPRYPSKTPLDDVLRKVAPGTDEFASEGYALEISALLREWASGLKTSPPALAALGKFLDASLEASSLTPVQQTAIRQGSEIEVYRRQFARETMPGRERFLEGVKAYFEKLSRIETAEFEVVGIEVLENSSLTVATEIRYDLVGARQTGEREQRIGHWRVQWKRHDADRWKITRWEATEETLNWARGPIFVDITAQTLGYTQSYKRQMVYGVDHWRTVLDGACGVDIYGNNGIAAGDFDNDGLDDLYVCQPTGLPNILYRNRGDGTFEDVTEKAGVGVLDGTACALFADFENKGLQDLLVVCGSGPLLFLNQGGGKFSLKRDAFQFERTPQGTFTHAAAADYDGDGRLDIYFCVYSYYRGLDQYAYPVPYFDARNGPPNFLLHNEGNGTFHDRTNAAGLNVENDRYSFACAWGDPSGTGRQDLFVANDFGRSNLYRNNGDGTFAPVSVQAGIDQPGAGMSACWLDSDGDGKQDIYVADMWSAAGMRVSKQRNFHADDSEEIRALYCQHARGNSLYRNQGNGKFQEVSEQAGPAMGRWSWCSDSWDFDQDGYADLYIANGYISGPERPSPDRDDLGSFFWRQVVGKSPSNDNPSANYEHGWNAINELVRSDYSWNGYERNLLYMNNRDGTFSDVSGVAGMDFPEDGRSFCLADIDGDGRLEVILKNRNAPQLRLLRNIMKQPGHAIVLRLRGQKSNRDAIGAAVTMEAGSHRQTKYVQAGSGFLSQHTKELHFGLGPADGTIRATIRWPSGLSQTFDTLPVNHRIQIVEGSQAFESKPFASVPASSSIQADEAHAPVADSSFGTWLIEPLSAPDFSLPDLDGNLLSLRSLRGGVLLLSFCATSSSTSLDQLRLLQKYHPTLSANGVRPIGINVDEPADLPSVKSLPRKERLPFPLLLCSPDVAGVYNIIYRYLFDRRRDLGIPTSFLVDKDGKIVKVYQGELDPKQVVDDVKSLPNTASELMRKALPFEGVLCQDRFERNEFTYGVALFQRGYLEQAAASFQQAIERNPENAEAQYNLGTLYLRSNRVAEARQRLQRTVELRPNYPEAWNNLGMMAAQEGKDDEAIRDFEQSLQLRPGYAVALLNLGNLYRRQGKFAASEALLARALAISPDDPEVNYNLGMLYARQEQLEKATPYLEKAVSVRPDYPDALNNLGVLFVQRGRNSEAEEKFQTCIRVAPNFDQAYLNLARLYVVLNEKDKARDVLQALLQMQPGHALAKKALETLN